jgi:hypothetical protein
VKKRERKCEKERVFACVLIFCLTLEEKEEEEKKMFPNLFSNVTICGRDLMGFKLLFSQG